MSAPIRYDVVEKVVALVKGWNWLEQFVTEQPWQQVVPPEVPFE